MLLYVSIFTILLSLILLFSNWNINRNATYLSLFLISSSVYGIAHYFVMYGKSPFWLAIFYNHFTPLMLLLGPFLLFYVRGTLNDTYTIKKIDFLHFIPALVHLIGIIPYTLQPFSEKLQIANAIIHNIDTILNININLFYNTTISFIIRPVLLLCYILYCMYLLWKRFSVSNFDYNIPKKQLLISVRWLIILIVSLFFIVIEFLIITFNSIQLKPSIGLINSYPLYILSGVAYCIMSFSLLLFPNILYGIPRRTPTESTKKSKTPKQVQLIQEEATIIEEDPFFDLSENIKKYLNDERPFIHPDFSISDIALALQVPQNHVSYCINTIMQTKFSALKSDLRIDYAAELLSENLNESFTIEGIAQQSGFRTRASFYNAFKEKIGVTPTEFIAAKTNPSNI
ncbi:AraC family transcriptional regulator [Flavobacterium sp.]|uniref:helix-turn-helix domain-containing protein n=1 Tax=Flavobacterium sp. TaxID=239 RepID=UPI0025F36CFE|nr:AraC family transcriptional regulator [Flavobacterium sp.]